MKNQLLVKILGAMGLAFVVGSSLSADHLAVRLSELLGQLFLNGLTLVVIPLVVSSIILGAARFGREGAANEEHSSANFLGFRLFGTFLATTTLAVSLGFCLFHLFSGTLTPVALGQEVPEVMLSGDRFSQFSDILLRIVPPNLIAAASQGQILGLILFCLSFGYFAGKLPAAKVVVDFWDGVNQVMMAITHLVMKALPIGVFGLLTHVIATTGLEMLAPLSAYFLLVVASLLLFALVVIPLILRQSPIALFRTFSAPLLTAFSTTSSAATLPVALECVEEELKVPSQIAGITLPVGASMSFCGSAMNTCMATLFIAHVYGVPITFEMGVMVVLMSILTSFGMGGIPSAVLVAQVIVLQTVGLPAEGIGLIMAVERFLDMVRTPVNVLGNMTCTLLTAKQSPIPATVPQTS